MLVHFYFMSRKLITNIFFENLSFGVWRISEFSYMRIRVSWKIFTTPIKGVPGSPGSALFRENMFYSIIVIKDRKFAL